MGRSNYKIKTSAGIISDIFDLTTFIEDEGKYRFESIMIQNFCGVQIFGQCFLNRYNHNRLENLFRQSSNQTGMQSMREDFIIYSFDQGYKLINSYVSQYECNIETDIINFNITCEKYIIDHSMCKGAKIKEILSD